ncbi:MAG TPA: PIG-L deacetylase family protein [Candidatus Saccharimonadales bacterium]
MKKIIFAIFAHPDDEAFGPAGTLLQEVAAGAELHLILLTNGDGGTNPDNVPNLGDVRLEEWKTAGTLIGAHKMHYLGYEDGHLGNHTMIEASRRIIEIVQPIIEAAPVDSEIECLSMDLNGLTGHIDHIVAARATCFAFYHLKQHDNRLTRLRLHCLSETDIPTANINWLYMEAGHAANEINETIDATQYRDQLLEIIHTHHTQRADGQACIDRLGDRLGINHFIVMQ